MPDPLPPEVTQMLGQLGGEAGGVDDLVPLVYEELRRLASRHMAKERPDHTLQATALVNEVYLRMKKERGTGWKNRNHFFAVAAQMMRFILVDYARRHSRAKRGGGVKDVTLDEAMVVSSENSDEFLALHEALQKLEEFDARKGRVATMRFFEAAVGRTGEERAAFLEKACVGDTELRREVEKLLVSDQTGDGYWVGSPRAWQPIGRRVRNAAIWWGSGSAVMKSWRVWARAESAKSISRRTPPCRARWR